MQGRISTESTDHIRRIRGNFVRNIPQVLTLRLLASENKHLPQKVVIKCCKTIATSEHFLSYCHLVLSYILHYVTFDNCATYKKVATTMVEEVKSESCAPLWVLRLIYRGSDNCGWVCGLVWRAQLSLPRYINRNTQSGAQLSLLTSLHHPPAGLAFPFLSSHND